MNRSFRIATVDVVVGIRRRTREQHLGCALRSPSGTPALRMFSIIRSRRFREILLIIALRACAISADSETLD